MPIKLRNFWPGIKSISGNKMKNLLPILALLLSTFIFSQTKAEKINFILKTNGSIEGYKSFILDFKINPLKYSAGKADSLKLVSMEQKLTDVEISKRLSRGFADVFNDKEIEEIYDFYQTSGGKKMISSNGNLETKFKENFQDIFEVLKPIADKISRKQNEESALNKEIPVAVDREDGFYEVVNFDPQYDQLKDLQLSAKPSVSFKEISTIKKVKDLMDRNNLDITLTKEGAKKFRILTENNINKPVAIVLNKMLVSAPKIMSEIPNGRIQISGNFTEEEINEIINMRNK